MDRSQEIVDNPDAWVAEHIRDYVAIAFGGCREASTAAGEGVGGGVVAFAASPADVNGGW
jgi:hypothetical protein